MTASSARRLECPDDLELAAYVDGRLSVTDAQAVASHIAECGRCAAVLVETTATIDGLRAPVPARRPNGDFLRWLAVAALLVLAVVTYRSFFAGGSEPAPQRAFARFLDAYAGSRIIEPRVTGQQSHAPFTETRGRSAADAATNPNVRRAGLAVEETVRGRVDADSLAVLGRTQLLLGQLDEAIATLTKSDLETAEGLNDLAAAYIARGAQNDSKEDIRRGLEFVDKAIGSGARGAEVRFNRALALERLGRTSDAIPAWREYVNVESDASWRREGEDHLERLSVGRISFNLRFPRRIDESGRRL
jgi:tetratricopeptide (TPR) repeat protein